MLFFRAGSISALVATTKQMPDYKFEAIDLNGNYDMNHDYVMDCDCNTTAPFTKFVSEVPVNLVWIKKFYCRDEWVLKRVFNIECFSDSACVVLWRGWCGTLKRVVWYLEEGGVVLWRGWCGTLKFSKEFLILNVFQIVRFYPLVNVSFAIFKRLEQMQLVSIKVGLECDCIRFIVHPDEVLQVCF